MEGLCYIIWHPYILYNPNIHLLGPYQICFLNVKLTICKQWFLLFCSSPIELPREVSICSPLIMLIGINMRVWSLSSSSMLLSTHNGNLSYFRVMPFFNLLVSKSPIFNAFLLIMLSIILVSPLWKSSLKFWNVRTNFPRPYYDIVQLRCHESFIYHLLESCESKPVSTLVSSWWEDYNFFNHIVFFNYYVQLFCLINVRELSEEKGWVVKFSWPISLFFRHIPSRISMLESLLFPCDHFPVIVLPILSDLSPRHIIEI